MISNQTSNFPSSGLCLGHCRGLSGVGSHCLNSTSPSLTTQNRPGSQTAWFTQSWLGNLDRLHYLSVPPCLLLYNGNNNTVTSSVNLLAPLLRTMFIKWQLKSAVRVPTANFLSHRCLKTHSWKKATHFLHHHHPPPLISKELFSAKCQNGN